jgi:phenol 2-monooxygenase
MNVSMMDSYNLAWKLVHSIHGLTPPTASASPDPVLETFELERVDIARQLIDFDTKFSHMFSGKIGSEDPSKPGLTHDEFLRVFSEGSGFTSGCGLQYHPSRIVKLLDASLNASRGPAENLEHGYITPGKRLLNVELKRYADGSVRQLHDGESFQPRNPKSESTQSDPTCFPELGSSGRYTLMILASTNLLDPNGTSQKALQSCSKILADFPTGVIDLVVLQPLTARFEWTDLPKCVKELAEMKTYSLAKREDAYEIYGIPKQDGALVVVRPDGYVGMLGRLDAPGLVEGYFEGCLVKK